MELGFPKFDPKFPGWERQRWSLGLHKIYVLIDPRDKTVRYVGYTANENKRKQDHQSRLKPGVNSLVHAWRQELFDLWLVPEFKVIDATNSKDWEKLEQDYIAYYRKLGRINNIHRGGALHPACVPLTPTEIDNTYKATSDRLDQHIFYAGKFCLEELRTSSIETLLDTHRNWLRWGKAGAERKIALKRLANDAMLELEKRDGIERKPFKIWKLEQNVCQSQ